MAVVLGVNAPPSANPSVLSSSVLVIASTRPSPAAQPNICRAGRRYQVGESAACYKPPSINNTANAWPAGLRASALNYKADCGSCRFRLCRRYAARHDRRQSKASAIKLSTVRMYISGQQKRSKVIYLHI